MIYAVIARYQKITSDAPIIGSVIDTVETG